MNLDRESGTDGITLIDWTAQSDTLPSGETLDASATVIGNITAGTAGTSSATSGNSFSIPYVTVNESGYVTAYGTHTHTVSDTDTKVTQTLTTTSNTSFRPLLLGYTYSDANPPNSFATVTNSVYAQHNVFIRPSTGELFVGNSVTANGSFVAKVAYNLAAADNGVSSTTWRGFYVQDSAGRISAQLSNGVYSNGNNHAWFGVRNFNTSGTMTADVGLGITAAKDGTLSWSVSGPTQFRQAIQAVRAIYGTYTSANALTDRGHALVMCNLAGTNTTVNPNGQTGWHHFINMTWSDAADLNGVTNNEWGTQIANKCGTTDLWVRSCNGITITDGTAWTAPWVRILTGSNWTNVITLSSLGAASSGHLHDSRYVLKAGDTMTGSLTVSSGGGYHLKFNVDTSRMNGYDW